MAVTGEGWGMPAVSGELNVQGVPTRPREAKLPGVVPCPPNEGSPPTGGSFQARSLPNDVETEKSSDMRVSVSFQFFPARFADIPAIQARSQPRPLTPNQKT